MTDDSTDSSIGYSVHVVLEIDAEQREGERVIFECGVPEGRRLTLAIAADRSLSWTYHDGRGVEIGLRDAGFATASYRTRRMYIDAGLSFETSAVELALTINGSTVATTAEPVASFAPIEMAEMAVGASLAGGNASAISVARAFLYPGRIEGEDAEGLVMYMRDTFRLEL